LKRIGISLLYVIQYVSKKFCNVIDSYDRLQSLGVEKDCFDNAIAEALFLKTLKMEQIYKLIDMQGRWNSIYLNLLKLSITEKKALYFNL
jgi:hypothetical protein